MLILSIILVIGGIYLLVFCLGKAAAHGDRF